MCLHGHFCKAVNAAAVQSTGRRQPQRDARQPFLRLVYLKSKLILMNLRQRRQIRKMRQINCICPENVIRIYYTIFHAKKQLLSWLARHTSLPRRTETAPQSTCTFRSF